MTSVKNKIDSSFIKRCLSQDAAFACWSIPGSQKMHYSFCNKNELVRLEDCKKLDQYEGFVFAPYKATKEVPIYIIPDNAKEFIDKSAFQTIDFKANKTDYYFILDKAEVEFKQKVEQFVDAFEKRSIKKAVLSRTKWLDDYNISTMHALFFALNQNYQDAFVYQLYIPGAGYWVGATPELLMATENGHVSTVSLAGTQACKGSCDQISWEEKELVEQELVSEHIRSVIYSFGIESITEKGPITTKAGNVVHLKTWFEFKKEKIKGQLGQFIHQLHPTPAICGLPVQPAIELIDEVEGYNRSYYTGFLGLFRKEQTQLYVNLRCLQAFENGVALYAGGGITPDSKPDNEWEETQLKMQTLQYILDNLE